MSASYDICLARYRISIFYAYSVILNEVSDLELVGGVDIMDIFRNNYH